MAGSIDRLIDSTNSEGIIPPAMDGQTKEEPGTERRSSLLFRRSQVRISSLTG